MSKEAAKWTQARAIALACAIEPIAASCHMHVALTGGCLYKTGLRKDADLLFYKIRTRTTAQHFTDVVEFLGKLEAAGLDIVVGKRYDWVVKSKVGDLVLDLFFPEDYVGNERTKPHRDY